MGFWGFRLHGLGHIFDFLFKICPEHRKSFFGFVSTIYLQLGTQTRKSINLHSITCVPYQCLLCITGKYESNLIAQQLVAHYADHTIEGLELLTEVRLDQGDDASMRSDDAGERARAFLLKLEEAMRPDSGLALVHRPEKKATMTTISTIPCPWEDSSGYSQTTG